MTHELIRVEEKFSGQVLKIQLNAAPANILSMQMMEEISEQLALAEKNARCKLVIFAGTGAHFSFGASVDEHLPQKVNVMLPRFHKFIGHVLQSPLPTVAQVTGMCLGGGFELALACSLIFADETAKCGVPEIHLGVFPPVAAALLTGLASASVSTQMILTGEKFSARELQSFGLVNRVAAAGTLEADLDGFIEKHFLPKSASSLRLAHRAARQVMVEQYLAHIGLLEKLYLDELMKTRDAAEGIGAFVEKRPAKWSDQ